MKSHVSSDYIDQLRRIRYIANVCIVLELDRSLSNTYWLNVNDPGFPFVGVIEHTNFEPPDTYDGCHIVYLSKSLPETDPLYQMADGEVVDFTLEHLARMFLDLTRNWVHDAHVWRAQYSQPTVEQHYTKLIPENKAPIDGFYLGTMAQIYPEDRGTNYAIRQGRAIARLLTSLPCLATASKPIFEKKR
jgi:protoporphyrinogen oxidase